MKQGIHPTYYPKATVKCVCGTTYTIGATQEEIKVEICRSCHPFYTGTEKIIDTAGRVERFKSRVSSKKAVVVKKKEKRAARRTTTEKKTTVKKSAPKKKTAKA